MAIVAGIVIAIAGCTAAFFSGAPLIAGAFLLLAFVPTISLYWIKSITALSSELIAENHHFRTVNSELKQIAQDFRETNETFEYQVLLLTTQVSQLTNSAQRIKEELTRFAQENGTLETTSEALNVSIAKLKTEIETSHVLSEQISQHLRVQNTEFGKHLEELKTLLQEIHADRACLEKIQTLVLLNTNLSETKDRLTEVQIKYSQELAKWEALTEALEKIKNEFDTANGELRENIGGLANETEKIRLLVNSVLAENPPC